MLGSVLEVLYASPTRPTPSAAVSTIVRSSPVRRETSVATAIVPAARRMPRLAPGGPSRASTSSSVSSTGRGTAGRTGISWVSSGPGTHREARRGGGTGGRSRTRGAGGGTGRQRPPPGGGLGGGRGGGGGRRRGAFGGGPARCGGGRWHGGQRTALLLPHSSLAHGPPSLALGGSASGAA